VNRPRLSVIVCLYDMTREAPRTLLSAGLPYQRDVAESDYEVIVVENGSKQPLGTAARAALPPGVRVVDVPNPQPSPVFALNWAARELARGDILLFAIDGARIFTQRLYAETLAAHDAVSDAFVYTLGWHIGPKMQLISTTEGYNEATEDRLIASSRWPDDPDALYDISVFAGSSQRGFFSPIAESNAFSVSRTLFERFGGYDERFASAGGGLSNLELFSRYVMRPAARNVCLLSEGSFHQTHGGVATSGKVRWEKFVAEYESIFGRGYREPLYDRLYAGRIRPKAVRFLMQSLSQ
jgi:glycosyltransferase involved in cell wall biosynthesis